MALLSDSGPPHYCTSICVRSWCTRHASCVDLINKTKNLYKIPSYLNVCTERNPMALTRFCSQSHQLIPTHKFTIENTQRVTYDQKLCPHCDQQATWTEIHILLQCPGTKHIAKDLIATLTTLLTHSHQPTWNSLTQHQQTSIMLADPITTLPKKSCSPKRGCTLPSPTFSHTY